VVGLEATDVEPTHIPQWVWWFDKPDDAVLPECNPSQSGRCTAVFGVLQQPTRGESISVDRPSVSMLATFV
jgi:hypothetical protein